MVTTSDSVLHISTFGLLLGHKIFPHTRTSTVLVSILVNK